MKAYHALPYGYPPNNPTKDDQLRLRVRQVSYPMIYIEALSDSACRAVPSDDLSRSTNPAISRAWNSYDAQLIVTERPTNILPRQLAEGRLVNCQRVLEAGLVRSPAIMSIPVSAPMHPGFVLVLNRSNPSCAVVSGLITAQDNARLV